MNLERKPKIGMLFIGAERFCPLGEGTKDGTYAERKEKEYKDYIKAVEDYCDVIHNKMVCTREQAEEASRIFKAENVDCVVAIFLSWAEDYAWISFLRELDRPLMLASVVRDGIEITDTHDENQFVDFLSAGALVGFLEASGSVKRFGINAVTEIGVASEIVGKIRVFATASKVKSLLKRSTISLLACYNEAMYATYVDPYNVYQKIGPRLKFLSVAELESEIEKIPDIETRKVMDALSQKYRIHPAVDRDKFFASVRATLAMESLAKKADTDLLVLNDIDTALFAHIGLRPGFASTNPENTMVTVPEGDIGGGLAVFILKAISGKCSNFIEPFYINKTNNTFAAGHAGPNDYTENPENVIIARDERFAKTSWKYAGAPFAWCVFPEGEKTMLHMSEENGRMKMVATVVECLPTKHYLASYSHADFRHKHLSSEDLFKKIASCGVNQHFGITPGNHIAELEAFAKIMDFDFYSIN